MRFTQSILALAAATAVTAGPVRRSDINIGSSTNTNVTLANAHSTDITFNDRFSSAAFDGGDNDRLRGLDILPGRNSYNQGDNVWIGGGGFWDITFTNLFGQRIILVLWEGKDNSFVNVKQPAVTFGLNPGDQVHVGLRDGISGAWSAVYPDTPRGQWGQVSNSWGEFTTGAAFDVSQAANMNGSPMLISGGGCTSATASRGSEYGRKCVFVCPDGQSSCQFGVQLINCETGSQPGAGRGSDPYTGADSGGCHVGGPQALGAGFY